MKKLKELINDILVDLKINITELPVTLYSHDKVPTLKKDYYRNLSPMLKVRFGMFSSWKNATHGDWLSIEEMMEIWRDDLVINDRLWRIKENQIAARNNWDNDASSLFKNNRLSLFAGSESTYERIYLLWLDSEIEPEIWVYDCNGESRYKNLESYLNAYINDDVSASNESWRAKY